MNRPNNLHNYWKKKKSILVSKCVLNLEAITCGSTLMTHCAGRCEAIWVTISQGNDRRFAPLLEGEGLVSIVKTDASKSSLWGKMSQ